MQLLMSKGFLSVANTNIENRPAWPIPGHMHAAFDIDATGLLVKT